MTRAGVRAAAIPDSAVPRLLAGRDGTDLAAHRARYGPCPVPAYPGRAGRRRLIETVAAAGLRGRGGAGFPTGRKLAAVAAAHRRPVVLGNGCEGEPASRKDHTLLTVAPHLVLDGAVLAAHALATDEIILCIHAGDPVAATVAAAIAERDDPVHWQLAEVPPGYVTSEESALVNLLSTGNGKPTSKPPRPAERGVHRRPTLVDNVETLAHLGLIARHGADWFRSAGTTESPGSTLVTIGGAVRAPGVYEIALGMPLGAVLDLSGGPVQRVQAVLAGGYGGTWLPLPEALGVPLSHEGMHRAGAALGVPVLLALPAAACGLAETSRLLSWLAGQSAGQCGPCTFGLPALAADLAALVAGRATAATDALLHQRLRIIPGRGACGLPDGAVRLAASALDVFARDLHHHQAGQPCRHAGQPASLPAPPTGWKPPR